jgi:23S rRNA (uracil1939-C5)-methyltransferase
MAILNDQLDAGTLPDYHGQVRLDVHMGRGDYGERLHVLVRPTERRAFEADLAPLVSLLAGLAEIGGVSRLRPDGSIETVSGPLFATVDLAGWPVSFAAASFFQTNLLLLPKVIARIQEEAQPLAGKRAADVYGGVGIFGLFLAQQAQDVVEIEADALAIEASRLTAARWGLSNVAFVAEPAEEALAEAGRFDMVVVDPPRSGLSDPVVDALIRERPPLILYVSCLAQSLTRNLSALIPAGYEVTGLELFDFYPQTYHVELLAVLRR